MAFALVFWGSVATILYVYLAYPLLVTALAACARRDVAADPGHRPTVTMIIAAYNEERFIARKLSNTLELDYPRERLQVIVAADGSDDRTAEIARGFADRGVELLHRPGRAGKMAAITRAMALARGEVVVFSDANNMYDPQALRFLVAPLADPAVGAVSGAKTIVADERNLSRSEGLYWRYESFIKRQETRLGSCVAVAGEILAIRRALFAPPPPRIINDDFYIAMQIVRAGHRVVYAPQARSSEHVSATARDEVARRSRIVAGRYQAMLLLPRLVSPRQPLLVWQVVSHKFLRPLVPFAMLGALLASASALAAPVAPGRWPALVLSPPWNLAAFALQAAFYLCALAGSRIGRGGTLGRVLYLPTFLVQSNYAALLGLLGLLRGKMTVVWKKVERSDGGP